MAKLTLDDLTNLENQSSAVATINSNSASIEEALDNTLSRDGTSPNTMGANLDMNSNRIMNLIAAASNTEPVRKAEFDTAISALSSIAAGDSDLIDSILTAIADAEAATEAAQEAAETVPTVVTLEQYGGVGDGSTDDYAALVAAAAAASTSRSKIVGRPGKTYKISGQFIPPEWFDFDLNGATLKPNFSTASQYFILSSSPTFTSYPVTTQTANSETITLTSAPATLAAGDVVRLIGTGTGAYRPPCISTVTSVVSTTVTLDHEIPFAMEGTVTLEKMSFKPRFAIYNGTIDCTNLGTSTLGLLFLGAREEVIWKDTEIVNFNLENVVTDYILNIQNSRKVRISDNRMVRADRNGDFVVTWFCEDVLVADNICDGDGFGMASVSCDKVIFRGNKLHGRRYTLAGSVSTRGIKIIGARNFSVVDNTILEYEDAIKVEDTAGGKVAHNTIESCGTAVNVSAINPNVAWGRLNIVDNDIRGCKGSYAISCNLDSQTTHVVIALNRIENSATHAIGVDGNNVVCALNSIRVWGTTTAASYPIIVNNSGTTGMLALNYAFSTDTSNNLGYYVAAATSGFHIGENFTNVTIKWAQKPSNSLASEITMELGGGFIWKIRKFTSVGTSFAGYSWTTAFPIGFIAAFPIVDSSAAAATVNVVIDTSGSDRTALRMRAEASTDVTVLAIGY